MTLTPEQRPTLTISESGVVLTEAYDGNEVPAEYSFAIVNDYVHAHGRHFEELQYLALGMASYIDSQQARIAELEQDAARYRWIDPNDKAHEQYLPWIGETVLFCHGGVTYYGQHTGGSFQTGHGVTARNFNTWECRWMYPPAAMQKDKTT